MLKKLFGLLLGAGFCLATSAAVAQQVNRPTHQIGEWCEYVNIYGNTSRHTVTKASPDGSYTVEVTGELIEPKTFRAYNADQELVRSSNEDFTPARRGPSFPLKVGGTAGGGEFRYTHSGTKGVTTILESIAEEVTVPAGTYPAIRVDYETKFTRKDGTTSTVKRSLWHALDPKVKRFVKYESINYRRGQKKGREQYEMRACGDDSTAEATK